MSAVADNKQPKDALLGPRRRTAYNAAEQEFSQLLQQRLQDLLQGKRDRLVLLRRYPREPQRLGVMHTPPSVQRSELRLPIVEAMIRDTINFIRLKATGGPISQQTGGDGTLIELQTFPTKFPHIVLERTDRYASDDPEPRETTWSLQRLQNQRAQMQLNQVLDLANLVFDILRRG